MRAVLVYLLHHNSFGLLLECERCSRTYTPLEGRAVPVGCGIFNGVDGSAIAVSTESDPRTTTWAVSNGQDSIDIYISPAL